MHTQLVLICGPPCSGKTTLGRALARELQLPFINKDMIKEDLFATLGWSDRAWSQQLGVASVSLMALFAGALLTAHAGCVLESTFQPAFDGEVVGRLLAGHHCDSVEVHCYAGDSTIVSRFIARSRGGTRHEGHAEEPQAAELRSKLDAHAWRPLGLCETTIKVLTEDFGTVIPSALAQTIRSLHEPARDGVSLDRQQESCARSEGRRPPRR